MLPVNANRFVSSVESRSLIKPSVDKIKYLENASDFLAEDKVRLLALLSQKRWITESDIRRHRKEDDAKIISHLKKMDLPWLPGHYTKIDGTEIYWVEVGANKAVLDYITECKSTLSVLEAGVLYGYPVTAVLGCAGIIEPKHKSVTKKNVAEYYLSGIFSEFFEADESKYFSDLWLELSKISPKIIAQAEDYYKSLDLVSGNCRYSGL